MTASAPSFPIPYTPGIAAAINSAPDDETLVALLPQVRALIGIVSKPQLCELVVAVIEKARSREVLDGEVRQLVKAVQMHVGPNHRQQIGEAVRGRRVEMAKGEVAHG